MLYQYVKDFFSFLVTGYNSIANEYGIFMPYLFLIGLLFLLSKVRLKGSIFHNSSDLTIPTWMIQGLQANKKNTIFSLLIGLSFMCLGYYFNLTAFYYFGWFAFGVSFAFFGFEIFHYFFPSSKIINSKNKKDRLGKNDIAVFCAGAFFLFVTYYQLRWPPYAEDPILGRVRVLFDISGKSFFVSMIILVLLKLGRHQLNVISVIFLLSISLLSTYIFLSTLFEKGGYDNEGYAFSFILAFATTVLILDDIKTSKRTK